MSQYDVLDALAAVNPVRVDELDGSVKQRGETLCDEILRQPRVERRQMPRRLVLAGAGFVAAGVLAATVVVWPTDAEPAVAATPPMLAYRPDGAPAAEVLQDLARRAERAPAPAVGRLHYVRMQSFYLDTASSGGDRASALRIVREERWLAPDGSGRAVDTDGSAQIVNADNAETMSAVTYPDGARRDERYGPGRLSAVADLSSMSTDPRPLAGQLAGNRTSFGWSDTAPNGPDWYRRVVVATGIAKQQAVPPALWAAMLRVLATTPGLTSQGTVTDREGRRAVAVSFDSTHGGGRPSRTVLLFSPDTGAFLGEEHILITKLGDGPYDAYLKTRIPAVTTYHSLLAAGGVATDDERLTGAGK
ncbi:CU044_5270 family protein [Actinomycetes bacterium KLBMP 9797]